MTAEETPIVEQVRNLTLRARAALQNPELHGTEIRELMWRVAALKGRLHCDPTNEFVGFLATLQHRLADAYDPAKGTGTAAAASPPVTPRTESRTEFVPAPPYASAAQGTRGVLTPR